MNELQEIYTGIINNDYFLPAILTILLFVFFFVLYKKEKGTRELLEGAAKLAISRAREKGLTVEEIYAETIREVEETILKRIEGKNVYRRLLGKVAIYWAKSSYVKGVITDFIRYEINEIMKK